MVELEPDNTDEILETPMITLSEYWNIFRTRLPIFIATVIIIVALAILYCLIVTPLYQATGRLLIEPANINVTRLKGVLEPTSQFNNTKYMDIFLQTHVELIRSGNMLTEVFTHFNFVEEAEFKHAADPVKKFRERLEVTPERKTFMLNITFRWKDAQKTAEVINYLMKLYIDRYRERVLGFSGQGVVALKEQLVQMEKLRQDSLKALVTFKRDNRIISLDDAQRLLIERISQLSESTIQAQITEIENRIIVDSIDKWKNEGGSLSELPEALTSTSLITFKLEHLRAQATVIELSRTHGKSHATVANQEKVVAAFAEAIQAEVDNAVAIARMNYTGAKMRLELLKNKKEELESETFRLDELSATYRILEDGYNAAEEAYQLVITRINEINITQSTGALEAGVNIMIETLATEPRSISFPRGKLIIAASLCIGIVVAILLCLLLDYLAVLPSRSR